MKTQQECWQSVISGETLENISDPNDCWCMSSDGHLIHAITGRHQPLSFSVPEAWRIKPKKVPFVEALRALVGGQCTAIAKGNGSVIHTHDRFGELLLRDLDAEWELVK